ncbi:DNA oxidative demethylase AlkB [Hyphomonas sp. KY3]|uniref:DNA oxidative demethylase AlkB n=1 Tax=Hyphomonas sp. KY3 TaxID=2016196 RepID=UPI001A8EE15C|nr:DNA oxidative demethylase AlkB [Hyphomonas sp. KY3]QSR21078.1 alpha-ketoglutarate-dependent dioxygenase AlkB [Hyphomonas sp. KY3]
MQPDLFDTGSASGVDLADGVMILRGLARVQDHTIQAILQQITMRSPFRHMVTSGGHRMSVAMTNCGRFGWVSDRSGYRYASVDPESGKPWPAMPDELLNLARTAASIAGYDAFDPDACLINRYRPGAKLSLHQDKNEADFGQPIVSVSLGLPAIFLFGGPHRNNPVRKIPLHHGDVVVWGGPARLCFHGVNALKAGIHPLLGEQRINLTFRKAI